MLSSSVIVLTLSDLELTDSVAAMTHSVFVLQLLVLLGSADY